jgi:hypothetical protein
MSNSEKVIIQAVMVEDRIVFAHDGNVRIGRPRNIVAQHKSEPPIPAWLDTNWNWIMWGATDLFPTIMREKYSQVPIAGTTLEKKIKMMLGNGLCYFKTSDLAQGPNVKRAYVQGVEDFLEDNRIHTEWLPAQCADYCLPYNCFSEITTSKDKSRITGLYHIAAEHARLSQAKDSLVPESLLFSYHFPFGTAQSETNRVRIPLFRWYEKEAFFQKLTGSKFAWHTRFPTPGLIHYATPWWIGLFREGGWMDVSAGVPKIVSAMQRNQVALKYIIAIPETYFKVRFPEWDTLPAAKRQEIIDRKVLDLNDSLSGTDNVFKSVNYVFKENEITGQPMGKIEITAVDDKAKSGTWVPDSYAADAQIVQGLGMDPSQIGLAPEGGKMGSGSGSDKRESYNLLITLNTPDQLIVLEPLNFISKFNGWGVTFVIDHTDHTTTNNQESGLKPRGTTQNVQSANPNT